MTTKTDVESDMKETRTCGIGGVRFFVLVAIAFLFAALTLSYSSSSSKYCSSTVYAAANSEDASATATEKRAGYVGDAGCLPCHKETVNSFGRTSHHLSSQLPGPTSILGSFSEGKNVLVIQNPLSTELDPRLSFRMEIEPGGYYEAAVAEMGQRRMTQSERIDIVTGSGVRGQTYLYWKGNELFELPVSYWTDGDQWINSPGYIDGKANFARHVDARCMECHASYIRALSTDPQSNVFDRNSLVVGISCETCHGPGAAHVEKEREGPAKGPMNVDAAIVDPAKLSRDRQVDLCGLCHGGGLRPERSPAFTYQPGAALDKFLAPNPADDSDRPDVHGNQVGMLKKSRCYLSSPSMSCSTCHDVHAKERDAADYSDRCLSCHKWQSCGVSRVIGAKIARNCIDCHMPMQETSAIVSTTAGRKLHTSIRSHWIKIYPDNKINPGNLSGGGL
jgi:hypothetical protein